MNKNHTLTHTAAAAALRSHALTAELTWPPDLAKETEPKFARISGQLSTQSPDLNTNCGIYYNPATPQLGNHQRRSRAISETATKWMMM